MSDKMLVICGNRRLNSFLVPGSLDIFFFLSEAGIGKQKFRLLWHCRFTVQWQTSVSDPALTPWVLLEIPVLKSVVCFRVVVNLESQ